MKFDFGQTFNDFFVETGAIPGTENHEEFEAEVREAILEGHPEPVAIKLAYGDYEVTGWMDEK